MTKKLEPKEPKELPVSFPEPLNFSMLNTPVRLCFLNNKTHKYINISAGIVSVDIPVSLPRVKQMLEWFEHLEKAIKSNA